MLKKESAKILGFLLASCILVLASNYLYSYKDMTGAPYSEIVKYREDYPYKTVTYTVFIDGSEEPLELKQNTNSVLLTSAAQADSMVAQAEYLQKLTFISFGDTVPEARQVLALQKAFPNASIEYHQVSFLGKTYKQDTTEIDLSDLTHDQAEEASAGLRTLPLLTDVYLSKNEEVSTVSLDDAAMLYNTRSDVTYHYTVELFGQALSTDMEKVEYLKVNIGDEGLVEFRKLLPMMYNLSYFKLDWCETSNEAMAQLRDDFPDIKVVWRVFMGQFNCLTDTIKVWATYSVTTDQAAVLKYCTDVKYLDLGHNHGMKSVEFLEYMPDLEVAIIAVCHYLESIEPIRNCTKLEYLELLSTDISDLSPLENLTELEYLNISHMPVKDLTPLNNLTKLKRLWSTMNNIPKDQIENFKELHPDCQTVFSTVGDPTGFTWRYMDDNRQVKYPRYALLTKQFGYDIWDFSRYPKGYVLEDITYESTGITPP